MLCSDCNHNLIASLDDVMVVAAKRGSTRVAAPRLEKIVMEAVPREVQTSY